MTEEEEKINVKKQHENTIEPNLVYIGSKEPNAYILYILSQLSIGDSKEIMIQARGFHIQKAIVVAELLKVIYIHDINYRIEIGIDLIKHTSGGQNYVPRITIHASRFAYVT